MDKNLVSDEELENVVGGREAYFYKRDAGNGKVVVLWSDFQLNDDQVNKIFDGTLSTNDVNFDATRRLRRKVNIGFSRMNKNYYDTFCERKRKIIEPL